MSDLPHKRALDISMRSRDTVRLVTRKKEIKKAEIVTSESMTLLSSLKTDRILRKTEVSN